MGLQTVFARLKGTFYRPLFNQYRVEGVRDYNNIVYDESNRKVCRLDVYRKTLLGNLPVFIFLHGGMSVGLGRQHRKGFCRYIASKGCAVLNLEYGTAPKEPFPAQIRQILSALQWAENNAEKYGFNMNNTIMGGDGTGAFLAVACCSALTDEAYAAALGITTDCKPLRGLACFCGMYDIPFALSKSNEIAKQSAFVYALTGIDVFKEETLKNSPFYRAYCPLDYIHSDFPPVFFSHSIDDKVYPGQAERLLKTLTSAQIPYWEFCALESRSKHIWNMELAKNEAKACNDAFGDFIKAACGTGVMTARYDI